MGGTPPLSKNAYARQLRQLQGGVDRQYLLHHVLPLHDAVQVTCCSACGRPITLLMLMLTVQEQQSRLKDAMQQLAVQQRAAYHVAVEVQHDPRG